MKRKALKKKATGGHVNRNAQFERIAELRALYTAAGNPILSVDTKKKELIGLFKNGGRAWKKAPIPVYDHDFPSDAEVFIKYAQHIGAINADNLVYKK